MIKSKLEWKKILGTDEEKHFMIRLLDKLEVVEKHRQIQRTDFIDPHLREVAGRILKEHSFVRGINYGGHDKAERKRIILLPYYYEPNLNEFGVALLRFQILGMSFRKEKDITHRDYLGAIIGTGIKREKIGDIWVLPDGCVVALDFDITQYVLKQNISVKGNRLNISVQEPNDFSLPNKNSKTFETTVSSLRLDAVAAKAYAISRSKVMKDITSGNMKVNWQEIKRLDHILKEGDVLSFRGKGRAQLIGVKGETKKGRIKVILEYY